MTEGSAQEKIDKVRQGTPCHVPGGFRPASGVCACLFRSRRITVYHTDSYTFLTYRSSGQWRLLRDQESFSPHLPTPVRIEPSTLVGKAAGAIALLPFSNRIGGV